MEKQAVGGAGGVTIDRCARCGALWLDKGEMERLLSMGAARQADLGPFGRGAKPNGPIAPLQCPRDGQILAELADGRQPHVLIMLCADCGGKLLDAGELTDPSEFTIAERLRAVLRLG
jgi:Zn-finger nucleic acid-binding protein